MARPDFQIRDGYEVSSYYWEDMVLHRVHQSADEAQIMRENANIRSNGGARNLSFGRPLLRMSYAQWLHLRKINPALASRDNQERTRAWLKLAQDGGYRNLSVGDK